MTWTDLMDLVGVVLLFAGSTLTLITAIGLVRFNNLFARMHASTKPQVLGLVLLALGLSLVLRRAEVVLPLGLAVVFQLITAPISAHMLGRAGYRSGRVQLGPLLVDEYTEDIDRAARKAASPTHDQPSGGPTT